MELILNTDEQTLLGMLLAIPPRYEDARSWLTEKKMPAESASKVGISYAEKCFLDYGDTITEHNLSIQPNQHNKVPHDVRSQLHSTYLYDVTKLLLEFGLEPNAVYETQSDQYNIMAQLLHIDNEYCAADTLALLLAHGGNPNLVVDGESIFEQIDFEIWFGSVEQCMRWRYDAWVHMWMVAVAHGGEITGKGPMVKVFKEYGSDEIFELQKLRNHRQYYYGLSMENSERHLHIYDKNTLWKVAEW
jgi:hypothetical protein